MRFSSIILSFALNLLSSQAYICHLCRDEGFPGKPNGGVVILQEVVPLPKPLYTCEELYYLGLEGGIIEKYCLPLVATVKEHCECAEFNTGPPDNTWTASTPTGNTWSWNVPWSSWDLPTPSSGGPPGQNAPFDLPVSFPTKAPVRMPIRAPTTNPPAPAPQTWPNLDPWNPVAWTAPLQAPQNSPAQAPQTLPDTNPWNPIGWTVPVQVPQNAPVPTPQTWPGTNPWNPTAWTIVSPMSAPAHPSPPIAPVSWPVQEYVPSTWNQATFVWPSGWETTAAPVQAPVESKQPARNAAPDAASDGFVDESVVVSSKGMSMSMKMKGMDGNMRTLRGRTTRH